ncbi:hypothetical protein AA103196_0722 [Ameyamaea chiangmaiensis NBRC 103196]|uniref:Uncharacterized protein n=1 Tax=Ameyamaea chiangmaiensis TaxID=442969 RepID=A0A850PAF2_9PROT|nr:hypothetical protein [Ameyamaea chiangmaiensis]MBS4075823.1 hypothetical protein [Ameyamaea chiangmaiensis]NVN39306.1 hypothetical protein [Ameyamaea chiangmaiensis]GBQ63882.1 hypothetical protein AA103196_0722 [Ameyamaea chiangmaiensis NBRC 103196]
MDEIYVGPITLSGMEIPDRVILGGDQRVVITEMPGGGRVINAQGAQPGPLVLEGRFVGPNALSRARILDQLRCQGTAVTFIGLGFSCDVWVTSFSFSYESKGIVCPYVMRLERRFDQTATTATTNALGAVVNALASSDAALSRAADSSSAFDVSSASIQSIIARNDIPDVDDLVTLASSAEALASIAEVGGVALDSVEFQTSSDVSNALVLASAQSAVVEASDYIRQAIVLSKS